MSVQLSYEQNTGAGVHGGIYDLNPKEVVSRAVENAEGIDFGLAVSRGTDLEKQIAPGGDGTFFGITVRTSDIENDANDTAVYRDKSQAPVLKKGWMWLTLASGCNPGDSANYADATGVIDSGAAGAGETDIANATFENVAAAGGLGLLRLPD